MIRTILSMLGLAAIATAQVAGDRTLDNKDCGAYCVGIVLKLRGQVLPEFSALRVAAETDSAGQTSMLNVARALNRYGVDTRASIVGGDPPEGLCVALLNKDEFGRALQHFIVIRRDEDGIRVYSPPYWSYRTDWEQIRSKIAQEVILCDPDSGDATIGCLLALGGAVGLIGWWVRRARPAPHGVRIGVVYLSAALALGACAEQPDPPAGPPLTASHGNFMELGVVRPGVREAEFQVRNDSSAPVEVASLTSTCGCAGAVLDTATPIRPGESRTCTVKIHVGPNDHRVVAVILEVKGAEPLVVQLSATGNNDGIRYQQRLRLGEIRVGAKHHIRLEALADRDIIIRAPNGTVLQEWSPRDDGPIRFTSWGVEDVPGEPSKCRVFAEGELSPSVLGSQKCTVAGLVGPTVSLRYLVEWRAVRDIQVEPEVVLLRELGDRLQGRLVVLTSDPDSMSFESTDDALTVRRVRTSPHRLDLEVSAERNWALGEGRASIRLSQRTKGDESAEVVAVVSYPGGMVR